MNPGVIAFIIVLWVIFAFVLTWYGIKLCSKINWLGLIPLFFALNLLGLVIGISIIMWRKDQKKN